MRRLARLGRLSPVSRLALLLALLAVALCLVSIPPAGSWLLERFPEALLRWAARCIPLDPRPHVVLGERLLARGEPRAALGQFEQAAARGSQELRLAVALADTLRAAGLYEKAAGQARQLLQLDPESGRLHRIMGQCQLELGQISEGLVSLETATRLAPRDADGWIALAEAHVGLEGFRPQTAQIWERGWQQNPGQSSLQYGLAETDVGLGRYDEAEALLQHLPQQPIPEAPKARELYARAWSAWGMVLHRLRPDAARRAQARRALERAVSLAPRHPETHYELGLLLAEDAEWDAARRSLETATRLRPYAHPFWYHLARVDRQLGLRKAADRAEARFDLLVSTFPAVNRESQYLDAHPDDVSRRIGLARLLIEREDWDAAALHLSLVLREHPGNLEASRLLKRLPGGRHAGRGGRGGSAVPAPGARPPARSLAAARAKARLPRVRGPQHAAGRPPPPGRSQPSGVPTGA